MFEVWILHQPDTKTMDFNTAIKRCGVMIIVLSIVVGSYGKVSDRTCTDGGGECDGIKNSYCCVCCSMCACSRGYSEHPVDGLSCELVVSATNCSVSGTECESIDNAKCNESKLKCECNEGYSEHANTCVVTTSSAPTTVTSRYGVLVLTMLTLVLQWWSYH